jgi:Ala-tRNA(Pro) deacylase
MNLEEKIVAMLEDQKVSYEIVDHEPVYTNPAMAAALNVKESEKNFVYFNPGVYDKSFKVKAWDLKKLCNPSFIR